MSIIRRAYEALKAAKALITEPPPQPDQAPDPETVDHVLHRLWSESAGHTSYNKREKRLWMILQRFVERKGGIKASTEDYKA